MRLEVGEHGLDDEGVDGRGRVVVEVYWLHRGTRHEQGTILSSGFRALPAMEVLG